MIETYDWAGGREAMMRFGPADGPVVAVAMPLFEEANRTRAFVVTILRALAGHGIGSLLPDLPGTGDSLVSTEAARLADWRAAFAAIDADLAVSVRGGALIPSGVRGHWQLSPLDGADQVRELQRLRQSGDRFSFGGNALSDELLTELEVAVPQGLGRIVRLSGDPRGADRVVEGAPLWRRAEPGNDATLAAVLAADIAEWVRTCGR